MNVQTDAGCRFLDLAIVFGCTLYVSDKTSAEKIRGKPLDHIFSVVVDTILVKSFFTGKSSKWLTSIERLLQEGADPNAVTRLRHLLKVTFATFHSQKKTEPQWPTADVSIWEYYLLNLWFMARAVSRDDVLDIIMRQGFHKEQLWTVIPQAATYLKICQKFLKAGAELYPRFSRLYEDPKFSNHVKEYERVATIPPDSVHEILRLLGDVACDAEEQFTARQIYATYPSVIAELHPSRMDSLRAEVSNTMDVLHER
ncbi:hypothetical protein EV356DRAFT_497195 [Viridothelium virens]|uniref:Uncharacterized protein n=1 Tax=Viridothelium virens TaxID=1048519 RepID=A0A6A6HHJ5_VIRVR|nr:hypothetical protein EV356DRAFT_497195 [Viridothelium virens]